MQELNSDAYGVAALSVVAAIVFKLVESKVMSKQEALDLYGAIATSKAAKAQLYGSEAERDAAVLAATMQVEIAARY